MNAITLKWEGIDLHANRDAWFNATEIAEAHGKRLDNFFALKRTQDYLMALEKQANNGETLPVLNPLDSRDLKSLAKRHPTFIKTRRGKYGGTWLHPDLMVCFARWISIEFEVWCDRTIRRLLTERPAWQTARLENKDAAKLMEEALKTTRAAQGKETKAHHYMAEHKLCNAILQGRFTGLNRDALLLEEQRQLTSILTTNAVLIASGKPYTERKARLQDMAASIRLRHTEALQ